MRIGDFDRLMEQVQRKEPEPANKRFTEGFNDCIMRVRSMIHSAPSVEAYGMSMETLDKLVKAYQSDRCIILPASLGDTVYVVHKCKGRDGFITEAELTGIHLRDEEYRGGLKRKEYIVVRCNGYSKHIPIDRIGEVAFFTKDAAVKALKAYRKGEQSED